MSTAAIAWLGIAALLWTGVVLWIVGGYVDRLDERVKRLERSCGEE